MEAVELGQISLAVCGTIKIYWKKGAPQELRQVQFSINDSVLTRQQLARTPILNKAAAWCIIDFCPDLLWREILLRITSETALRNKDVRDRMCKNGQLIDKATVTKRISSALGQKQGQYAASKNGGVGVRLPKGPYAPGEEVYYNLNCSDYSDYQAYFGKGPSMRKKMGVRQGQSKAAVIPPAPAGSIMDARPGSSGSGASGAVKTYEGKGKGKAKVVDEDIMMEDKSLESEAEGGAKEKIEDSEEDDDAVSVQSDGELDRMADD